MIKARERWKVYFVLNIKLNEEIQKKNQRDLCERPICQLKKTSRKYLSVWNLVCNK